MTETSVQAGTTESGPPQPEPAPRGERGVAAWFRHLMDGLDATLSAMPWF